MGKELKDDRRMLSVIDNTILILETAKGRAITAQEKKKVEENCKSIKSFGYDEIKLQQLIDAYQKRLEMQIRKLIRDEIIKNKDQALIESRMGVIGAVAKDGFDPGMQDFLLNSLKELNIIVKQHADITAANEKVDEIIAKLIAQIRKAE
jgi:hypothetical protein